jgi:shikimate dehydrogenase
LQGFAITIPHKKNIIPYLTSSSKAVQQIGACNCVKISNGNLYGFNTDVVGFKQSFVQQLQPHHTKALVLGTGGAAAAVLFVLEELGITYKLVSRQKIDSYLLYEEVNKEILDEYSIIINCSPVGTYPNVNEAPAIPYEFLTSKHYLYDLVYNPPLTAFLLQAEENWKIWNTDAIS